MNINDEIKALKERIAELEELAKDEQEFPQDGDEYCYIDDEGYILNEKWDGLDFEEYRLAVGNVFKTKDQAEFVAEKLKVEAELRKFSRPFKRGRFNHYIFIDTDGNHLEVNSLIYGQPQGTIYFESKEKVQQAISTAGEERIKKYIFGVED